MAKLAKLAFPLNLLEIKLMVIKFTEMRKELIETLRILSDKKYQELVWIQKQYPKGVLDDNFDYAVNFLFDDHSFAEDPEELIGYCLVNKQEAKLVHSVTKSIDKLLSELGNDLSDIEYISSSLWDDVVQTAKRAYDLIKSNSPTITFEIKQ
jgi:hypothetical protein